MPHIRIKREDCVYDVGYREDAETGECRAEFIAKRDRYGQDMLAYTTLDEVIEQAGLDQFAAETDG